MNGGELNKAQSLRHSAVADEAAGRLKVAYTTLLQAWRVLRLQEGEPGVEELTAELRGDLSRLGEKLRSRSRADGSPSNEKTIRVQ